VSAIQFDVASLQIGARCPCGQINESGADITTIQSVQGAQFTLTWPRQDIYSWDGVGGQELIDKPRADLSFSYIHDGSGINENALGFYTAAGGACQALEGLVSEERNYYVTANLDHRDQIGYSGRNVRVLALGNGTLTHYDFAARVGQPSVVNVSVEGLNLLVQPSGANQFVPSLNKQAGTGDTQVYLLPTATQSVTDFFSAAPSAISLTLHTGSAMGILLSGAEACPVQSFAFSLELPRQEVRELGWAYPDKRPIRWPVTVAVRADVVLNAFQVDALNRYGCPDSGHAFSVGFKRSCTQTQDFAYRFEGAKLESQTLDLNVGGGAANASLAWSVQLNDLNRTGVGLPGFFIDRAEDAMEALGGTITDIPGYRVHTFTATGGNFTVLQAGYVDARIQGAGGGGGGLGGGGAGGSVRLTSVYLPTGIYPVVVGTGGAGGGGPVLGNTRGDNGGDSSFNGQTAFGGGGGGRMADTDNVGKDGGCGGGGGCFQSNPFSGAVGGDSVQGQGHPGGFGMTGGATFAGGGGGGTKTRGRTGGLGAEGGDGIVDDIEGSCKIYGAGGGGSGTSGPNNNGGSGNVGGIGGSTVSDPTEPLQDTGSGGGGAYLNISAVGTSGANGKVVIRYRR
jgi:hypothetical protein